MPEIKLQHVITFSSEGKNFTAANLLHGDSFKKWKGAAVGSKQETVTLQLEKAEQIHQVDIGNESSAFIEVLVGRSSSSDDFKVLLVASSFMNPMESRKGENANRVRIFSADKLNKTVLEEKWDRVKIVCTQPFNRNVQYGISFIKLHSRPSDNDKSQKTTTPSTSFGAFSMKPQSEDDGLKAGSLFANRQKEKTSPPPPQPPLTGAAALRAASKLAEEALMKDAKAEKAESSEKSKTAVRPNYPKKVPAKYEDSDDEEPAPKPSTSKPPLKRHPTSAAPESKPPMKKTKSDPPKTPKDFSKILSGVVFAMSGYQNPKRGDLRDAAMEMGAKYKSDWGPGCTHLICAFENTPKYNQVKGKGRIVKDAWITDCHNMKKKLPWRKYRLGRAPSPKDSQGTGSETEEEAEPQPKRARKPVIVESDEDYSPDTDEELRRIDELAENKNKKESKTEKKESIYDESTDEDGPDDTQNGHHESDDDLPDLPELPDFFDKKHFFLFGAFDKTEEHNLRRCIIGYGGELDQYMAGDTNFVISNCTWDENFDDALNDNASLAFVKPPWIFACDQKQKMVPYQKFAIVPQ